MTRFITALNKRLSLTKDSDKGFTLIELLVVVIIIGILAAIAIPVYLGIQNNAKDSSVQSDLTNAKTAVISVQTATGTLPVAATTVDVATKVAASDGYTKGNAVNGTIKYTTYAAGSPQNFCLSAVSVTTSVFFVTDVGGVQKVGAGTPAATLPTGC